MAAHRLTAGDVFVGVPSTNGITASATENDYLPRFGEVGKGENVG